MAKRPPIPTEPISIQREYNRLLNGYAREFQNLLQDELKTLLPRTIQQARSDIPKERLDDFYDDVERMIARVMGKLKSKYADSTLRKWAASMAVGVLSLSRRNLRNQYESVKGEYPGMLNDDDLTDFLRNRVSENVGLIRSIVEDRIPVIRNTLVKEITEGSQVQSIAKKLREQYGMTRSKAKFIAVDQVNKLNGQIDEYRQRSIGVKKYRWRNSGDERVRDNHRFYKGKPLDGQVFSWDDPPAVGAKGERLHPKRDYRCRCWAEPVLEDLGSR